MRVARSRAALAIALATALGGCGGEPGSDADRDQIAGLVREGHKAVREARPTRVCALLTADVRRNTLNYGTEYTGSGRRAPSRAPRTCKQAIGDQIYFAGGTRTGLGKLGSESPDIEFVKVEGRSAHVRVDPPDTDIFFVKTAEGWRADRTNDFPFDGSTGN